MNTTLAIKNLKWGDCANTIMAKLSHIDGIDNVQLDNNSANVSINCSDEIIMNQASDLLFQLVSLLRANKTHY